MSCIVLIKKTDGKPLESLATIKKRTKLIFVK